MPPRLEQFTSKAAFDAIDGDCSVSGIAGRSMTMREAANFKITQDTTADNNNDMLGEHTTMRKAANSKPVKEEAVQEAKYTGPVTMRRAAAVKHQEKKKAIRTVMAHPIE